MPNCSCLPDVLHRCPPSPPVVLTQLSDERDAAIVPIGNLVPDSVPVDDNEVSGLMLCVGWVGRWTS